jgi:diketogulonate reductase-like aldo/keto reductase
MLYNIYEIFENGVKNGLPILVATRNRERKMIKACKKHGIRVMFFSSFACTN